jgi:hypothetical protein
VSTTLSYRFEPLADLYFLLTDRERRPSTPPWGPTVEAIDQCLTTLANASQGRARPESAFHGGVAEFTSIDALEAAIPDLPDETVLGLPWTLLVEQAVEALRLAWPLYDGDLSAERAARVLTEIERVRRVLGPIEDQCINHIHECLELAQVNHQLPVILVGSMAFPGAFTAWSDITGAICFVGVDGLDGTALIETVLHEATHGFEVISPGRRDSILAKLGQRVREALPDDRAILDVPHSLIFVQAAETVRRLVDPEHVHYGVTHTYYDRVPTSRPVLEHWVRHLDGEIDTESAVQAIVADLAAGHA